MGLDFRQTWLWRHSFMNPRSDATTEEQKYFQDQYLSMRDKVAQLVSRIAADMPGMTVHDLTHLDALWDTASLIAEGAVNVNPAEAFVFGASILLHDSGMSLAAYPGGISEVRKTIAWKDSVARYALSCSENEVGSFDVENVPEPIIKIVLPEVLRRLHAQQAEVLAEQKWKAANGEDLFLIDDADVRFFYGATIGQIAHSHWWPVQRLEELAQDLGGLAPHTRNTIDRVKLACLLRVADALHLDQRRAPRFLRAITNPAKHSALHWSFQERLARPHVELDSVVFTTGQPFGRSEAEAWWLAYDTLSAVDQELRDVDLLLQSCGRELLKARRVKGIGSPEALAKTVQTRDWRPVDARLRASDIAIIVENLGGSKLYGDDPTIALRELIQNAADAVQARRRFERRPDTWGQIKVSLDMREDGHWLVVEDTGIGMSEQVLTGPLIDFGVSFWRSPLAMEEFPGLIASGMKAIGRFGIGFFSVFMLGQVVRVTSRRCDKGYETARSLEFRDGTSSRPILWPAPQTEIPVDGGTKVEIRLSKDPRGAGGLLSTGGHSKSALRLARLVAAVAPNLDVAISTSEGGTLETVIQPKDWLIIPDAALLCRLNPALKMEEGGQAVRAMMRPIPGRSKELYGRAFIRPERWFYESNGGWVTISGLRSQRLANVQGVLMGEAVTAARDVARPLVTKDALAEWATEQAHLIAEGIADEEQQARSAEVILECGGDIGNLAIVKWHGEWFNSDKFLARLQGVDELLISFDGDFFYDEDQDEVHPREFKQNFVLNDNVAIVLKHDGTIIRSRTMPWPRSLTGLTLTSESNIAARIREIIMRAWGDDFERDIDTRVVGSVDVTDIERSIFVFKRSLPGD
ncbi:MAG: ATP-binding protein [Syntrophorhabdaceae bacterium]|nr:ATP-binding protein [Syntrophorhabdaceae bacterium]MDD5243396.1 ATP-binding protein [Syntrophorhabdaceae bacterium]